MGIVPISFQEIEAWARLTKTDLKPFEARLIKKLSNEFVAQHHDTRIKSVPPVNDWDMEQAKDFYGKVQAKFRRERRNNG